MKQLEIIAMSLLLSLAVIVGCVGVIRAQPVSLDVLSERSMRNRSSIDKNEIRLESLEKQNQQGAQFLAVIQEQILAMRRDLEDIKKERQANWYLLLSSVLGTGALGVHQVAGLARRRPGAATSKPVSVADPI